MVKGVKSVDEMSLEIQVEKLAGGIRGGQRKIAECSAIRKRKTASLSPLASLVWCTPPLLILLEKS